MARLSTRELAEISGYIKEKYGVNLSKKSTLIEGRLGCYIQTKGFESYRDYFEYAKSDPTGAEMTNLMNRITTNHTFFMREDDHFEVFSKSVLPWIDTLPEKGDLRIWCAGCASGEEPYGLSIYIMEYMAKHGRRGDTTILASDISEKALRTAMDGVYLYDDISKISPEWILKYFIDLGDGSYRVAPKLRANVAYKKINLLDPFVARKPYHAIFCRNVMIYFDAETRLTLINKFYDVMSPGGYLFIGHSESLTNLSHAFKYVQPSVYRRPLE